MPTVCTTDAVAQTGQVPGGLGYGFVTSFICNVTAVWANALPFSVAPVSIAISVLHNIVPMNLAVVPMVVPLATCQNTFLACAPPDRITRAPGATVRPPAIWNIQTAFWLPESVTCVFISTPVPHL